MMLKNSKKLVYIIDSLGRGGAEQLLLDISKGVSVVYDVTVLVIGGKDTLKERFDQVGIDVIFLGYKKPQNPFSYFSIKKRIKKIKPDIVHTHLLFSDIYGRLAALKLKVSRIYSTCHNTENWRIKKVNILYEWYKMIDTYLSQRITKIIAISNKTKEYLVKGQGINPDKIDVIYNGVDLNRFFSVTQNEIEKVKKRLRIMNSDFVLGSVGRLEWTKGHTVLVEAVSKVKNDIENLKVFIAGTGSQEQLLRKKIHELSLDKNLAVIGEIDYVPAFLHSIMIYVHPSNVEGFGLLLVEAMASGKPVVATKTGGIPEILTENTGTLFEPGDSDELAKIILKIYNDRADLPEFCQKCIERSKKFDIQKTIEGYLELYAAR